MSGGDERAHGGRTPYQVPAPPEGDALAAAAAFHARVASRRTVRAFSDRPVPRSVIEEVVRAASTAPSGAHKQPWRFVAVGDPALKRAIREGAESEERAFYGGRASDRWLSDLEPFQTDAHKPYLQTAPWLIVIFRLMREDDGGQVYYGPESVGIATGILITALHMAGLASLTHTPSPMAFLGRILDRPEHERPFLLLPVGYPAEGCAVPDLRRKPLDDVLVVHEGLGE